MEADRSFEHRVTVHAWTAYDVTRRHYLQIAIVLFLLAVLVMVVGMFLGWIPTTMPPRYASHVSIVAMERAAPVEQGGGNYVRVLRQIQVDVTAAGGQLMNNWQSFIRIYYPAWVASGPVYQAGRWVVTLSRYTYILQNTAPVPLFNYNAYCRQNPWAAGCPRPTG